MQQSKTGQALAGSEQRPSNETEVPPRFEAGQANAHDLHDPKDQRSLSNRQALEEQMIQREEEEAEENRIQDPLKPAQDHGNEPSRGAKIDAELQAEEQEYLERKGKA